MNRSSKIVVFGHMGLVGSAIMRKLESEQYQKIITITHKELDLRDQQAVNLFFKLTRPEYIFLAAATVGGIYANNTRRAEFIYDNLMIQTNVIHAAYTHGVTKLLALASACIYPRENDGTPITEEQLLTGSLEPTNEPYAVAKIAAVKMCDAYRHQYGCNFVTAMPTNMMGPNDHYDTQKSHVPAALIRNFIISKRYNQDATIWGTGTPRREFLYVDDMAEACLLLMQEYNQAGPVNIGTGKDHSINELAETIADIVGFKGNIKHDLTKPDGMPRRTLDVSKINAMGWTAKTSLREGLEKTIKDIYATKKHLQWP